MLYIEDMLIETVSHRALRRFIGSGNPRGVPGDVARIISMIAYLIAIEAADELRIPPNYGAHLLTGDRAGTWSLTVTRNWRMTFKINDDNAIIELNLEDYH